MSQLNISQETFDALALQVDELTKVQARNISDRDLSAVTDIIQRSQTGLGERQVIVEELVNKINQAVNALTIRFKRYASDAEVLASAASLSPSSGEKEALAGTNGVPSILNRFVTDTDIRLVNPRAPTAHAVSHKVGGSDPIGHSDLASGIGTLTHTQLETAISSTATNLATTISNLAVTDETLLSVRNWAVNLNLDNLPTSSTYAKITAAEIGRIPNINQYAAIQNSTASSDNLFMTIDQATSAFQPVGSYLTPSSFTSIGSNVLPSQDGTYNLGSPSNRWKAIYVGSSSLHIGDIHITSDADSIYIAAGSGDPSKIVTADNYQTFVSADGRVDLAEIHYTTIHDYDLIRSNTPELTNVSATDIANLKTHNHDSRYLSEGELITMSNNNSSPFNKYATVSSLTAGDLEIPWSSLTGVPTLASSQFKGTYGSFNLLPTEDLEGHSVYATRISKSNSQLAGLYVVANPSATNRDDIYKPVFDSTLLAHGELSGLTSDSHPQYYNLSRLSAYLAEAATVNGIKSAMGITSVGSGQIITDVERTRLTSAFNHSQSTGNVHNLTIYDLAGIPNSGAVIGATHLRVGNVNNAISTDSIPEGIVNKYATASMFSTVTTSAAHIANTPIHINPTERSKLFGNGDCDSHYHASDRTMSNMVGNLSASRIDNFADAVLNIADINLLMQDRHAENHTISSHTDTDITGPQLDGMFVAHGYGVYGDAHNALFASAGGSNGISTRVARSDHSHSYATLSQFTALSTTGTAQKVHWTNLTGIPQTVGNTRNFANLSALNAATPFVLGEQVVVLDIDGDGNWGVYLGINLSVGGWTMISSQTAGLAYAPIIHSHNDYVLSTALNGLVDSEIVNYFGLSGNAPKLVSNLDRTTWNSAHTTLNTHLGSLLHVSEQNRIDWEAASTHTETSSLHLTPDEKGIISSFDSSVGNTIITVNSVSKELHEWLAHFVAGSGISIDHLNGWPSHTNATIANLAKLFDGSDVSFHAHSAYSLTNHTHTPANIIGLAAFVEAYNYLDAAGVKSQFTSGAITTTDVHEGANKYLSAPNLQALNEFTVLQDHAANIITDRKHLAESEVNALTHGGITYLHKHTGEHYTQDDAIQVGRHRRSIVDDTLVGTAGYVTTKGIVVTETSMPNSSAAATGVAREIRFDDNFIYVKTPSGSWKRAGLSTF